MCGAGEWFMRQLQLEGPGNTKQHYNTYDGRIDFHINDKNTLFGRVSYSNYDTESPGPLPATQIVAGNSHTYAPLDSFNPWITTNVALDYVRIFSPKTLFEGKASFLRSNMSSYTSGVNYWNTGVVGLPAAMLTASTLLVFTASPLCGLCRGRRTRLNIQVLKIRVMHTRVTAVSRHSSRTLSVQWHAYFEPEEPFNQDGSYADSPADQCSGGQQRHPHLRAGYTGNSLSDLAEGLLQSISGYKTMIVHRGRLCEPSAFIQDDWRATPALTLNLGVRYDLYTPTTDRYGNISNFDYNTGLVVSPNLLGANSSSPTAGILNDYGDVSPRIGFAYSLNRDNFMMRNLVIRGGFGISYFPANSGTPGGLHEFELLNAPFQWSQHAA